MPIHPHDSAKRLKPKWVCEPRQKFVAAIMRDDRLAYNCSEGRHALRKPRRDATSVEWKISASGATSHRIVIAHSGRKRQTRCAGLSDLPAHRYGPGLFACLRKLGRFGVSEQRQYWARRFAANE